MKTNTRNIPIRTAGIAVWIAAAAGTVHAGPIDWMAEGRHLDGATLRVFWLDGSDHKLSSGVISADGRSGTASVELAGQLGVGFARFRVGDNFPGVFDTFIDDWVLRNVSPYIITSVRFDLNTQPGILSGRPYSIFDDGTMPSTAGSFAGRNVTYVDGPQHVFAAKQDPWVGKAVTPNLGDMYMQQWIQWSRTGTGPNAFLPGMEFVWKDDTDRWLPAPGTMALLAFGAVAATRRRRPRCI